MKNNFNYEIMLLCIVNINLICNLPFVSTHCQPKLFLAQYYLEQTNVHCSEPLPEAKNKYPSISTDFGNARLNYCDLRPLLEVHLWK